MTDLKPPLAVQANARPDVVRVCLTLGVIALGAGCFAGVEMPGDRMLVLALLGCSIALFGAALAMQLKRPAIASSDPAHAVVAPIMKPGPSPQASTVRPPATPPTTAVDKPRHEWPVAAFAGPATAPDAAAQPSGASARTVPSVTNPAREAKPSEARLDVPTLMQAPLADLLLAALCKDPEGARRIFTQVALQADSTHAAGVADGANAHA